MPLRLLTPIHLLRYWLGPLGNLMPKFHLALAAYQPAAGHADQELHYIRSDMDNSHQCPAMTPQLRRQAGQFIPQRPCPRALKQKKLPEGGLISLI